MRGSVAKLAGNNHQGPSSEPHIEPINALTPALPCDRDLVPTGLNIGFYRSWVGPSHFSGGPLIISVSMPPACGWYRW